MRPAWTWTTQKFWLKDQVTNGCEGHHDNDCSSSNG